jgi:hypothetical protein
MITLLETKVYEGEEVVAVAVSGTFIPPCSTCILIDADPCETRIGPCAGRHRVDGLNIIWMKLDDALRAQLRGSL